MAVLPPPDVQSRRVLLARIASAGLVFGVVLCIGVVGYLSLGDGRWTFEDALYMSVITLSTVGYGELEGMAEVPGARPFTMLLILAGTGALLYMMSAMTAFVVEGDLGGAIRRRTMDRRIGALSDHFILAGVGGTGAHTAHELFTVGHDFVAIDLDAGKFERLHNEFEFLPLHLVGDATDEKVLESAGIHRARGLICSLSDDRDNLFLTFTARAMNPRLRIVAKTVDPDNHGKIRRAGADDVISPTHIGGRRLVGALTNPHVIGFLDHMSHDTADPHRLEELLISPGSTMAGKPLRDLGIRERFGATVIAVRLEDGQYAYNPASDFDVENGMTLIVLVSAGAVAALRSTSKPG